MKSLISTSGAWRNRGSCKNWYLGWGLFYLHKLRYLILILYVYLLSQKLDRLKDVYVFFIPVNRLNYYVGGEIVTVSHLDK